MTGSVPMLLTGDQNKGKTTKLLRLYTNLKKREIPICGFAAPGIWEDEKKTGFNLLDLKTNRITPLATVFPKTNYIRFGRFYFNPKALIIGNQIMKEAMVQPTQITFIDEIGKFELMGFVWHESYQKLIKSQNQCILTVVRKQLLTQIKEKYNLLESIDYNLSTDDKIIINRLLNLYSKETNHKVDDNWSQNHNN